MFSPLRFRLILNDPKLYPQITTTQASPRRTYNNPPLYYYIIYSPNDNNNLSSPQEQNYPSTTTVPVLYVQYYISLPRKTCAPRVVPPNYLYYSWLWTIVHKVYNHNTYYIYNVPRDPIPVGVIMMVPAVAR